MVFFHNRRPHFVFYRGLITKLLCTPYENLEGWKIAAMSKNNTIYIRNLETPESISNRQKFNSNPRLKRFSQWGRYCISSLDMAELMILL